MKNVVCKQVAFNRVCLVPNFKTSDSKLYTFHLQPELPFTSRNIIKALHNDLKFKTSPFYSKEGIYFLHPDKESKYRWGWVNFGSKVLDIVYENGFIYKKESQESSPYSRAVISKYSSPVR